MASSWDPTGAYDNTDAYSLKVAQTRRRLARGTYQVDLDAVAARLIDTIFKRGHTL
jgi:anti-sigma28 factor (negative regulator of flagellin synthesis)